MLHEDVQNKLKEYGFKLTTSKSWIQYGPHDNDGDWGDVLVGQKNGQKFEERSLLNLYDEIQRREDKEKMDILLTKPGKES